MPLVKALEEDISGNFWRAAVAWCSVLTDPAVGLEDEAATPPSELSGDAEALAALLDKLLLEHEALMAAVAVLDVERCVACASPAAVRPCRGALCPWGWLCARGPRVAQHPYRATPTPYSPASSCSRNWFAIVCVLNITNG